MHIKRYMRIFIGAMTIALFGVLWSAQRKPKPKPKTPAKSSVKKPASQPSTTKKPITTPTKTPTPIKTPTTPQQPVKKPLPPLPPIKKPTIPSEKPVQPPIVVQPTRVEPEIKTIPEVPQLPVESEIKIVPPEQPQEPRQSEIFEPEVKVPVEEVKTVPEIIVIPEKVPTQPKVPTGGLDFDFDDFDLPEPTTQPTIKPKPAVKPRSADLDFDDFDFQVTPDDTKTSTRVEQEAPPGVVGLPISIPYIGTILLIPFTDQAGKSGYRAKFADSDKKIVMGDMTIDDGTVSIIDGKFGITGRATLFGNSATFGLKEMIMGEKRSLQKAVLGVSFAQKPTLDFLGTSIALDDVDIELVKDKPVTLLATTRLFGQKMLIGFVLTKTAVGAYLHMPANTKLIELIPAVNNTPLAPAVIKEATLTAYNLWSKEGSGQQRYAVVNGVIDVGNNLQPDTSQPAETNLHNAAFTANIAGNGVKASIKIHEFPMQHIGLIHSASIELDTTTTPKKLTLLGKLSFYASELGDLQIEVSSAITSKGVIFAGSIPKEFNYAGLSLKEVTASFDTFLKAAVLKGKATVSGLNMDVSLTLLPDPEDQEKRIIQGSAHGTGKEFAPFSSTDVPGLETVKLTDFDAKATFERKQGKITTSLQFEGDVHVLGRSLKSLVKLVENEQGQKGYYINAPLTENYNLDNIVPGLDITLKQGSFLLSSINFYDTERKLPIKKGMSLLAKAPLTGMLAPVAKLLGNKAEENGKPKEFIVRGTINLDSIQTSQFGIILSDGDLDQTATFSLGQMAIEVSGEPSMGVKADVYFRPSSQEQYVFIGKFSFKPTTANLDARMDGTWNNAFGFDGWSIENPAIVMGMLYGSPGIPTEFGGTAHLKVKDYLDLRIAFIADAALKNIAFEGSSNRAVTLVHIAALMAQAFGLNIPTPDIPGIDLYDLYAKFATKDTAIGSTVIKQGVAAKAKLDVLGKTAEIDAKLDSSGFKAYGGIDPINLIEVLKVYGEDEDRRAKVDIEMTLARQKFLITGILELVGFYKKKTFLEISSGGISFTFEDAMGGGELMWDGHPLFLSRVHGQSSGGFTNPDFMIEILFEQYLQKFIKAQIDSAFNKAKEEVEKSLQGAANKVDETLKNAAESADKEIAAARQAVADLRKKKDDINKTIEAAQSAIDSAQKDVDSLLKQRNELNDWYYSLPAY